VEPQIKFRQADRTDLLLQNIVESMGGGFADGFHAEVLLNSAAGGYSKAKLGVVGDASSQASYKNPKTEDKERACFQRRSKRRSHQRTLSSRSNLSLQRWTTNYTTHKLGQVEMGTR